MQFLIFPTLKSSWNQPSILHLILKSKLFKSDSVEEDVMLLVHSIKERTKYQNDEKKNNNVTEEEAKNRSYKTRKKKKEQNDSSLA